MVSLPDGEKISKISLFVLAQLRNVTDRQTDGRTPGDSNDRAYASHRAVKIHILAKMVVARCLILCSKFTNNRLPTGLRPDPLRELTVLDHGGKMGKKDGREKGTEGEGRESGRGGEEKGRERGTPMGMRRGNFQEFSDWWVDRQHGP